MLEFGVWIIFLLIDLLAIYQIILLIEIPFGIPMKISYPFLCIVSGVFMIAQVLTEIFTDNSGLICLILEFVFLIFFVLCFSQKKKWKALLFLVPAVLIYMEWGYFWDMLAILFGFDDIVLYSQNDVGLTIQLIASEVSLFIFLIVLKYNTKKIGINVTLTLLEGILITIFCIFSPIAVEIMLYLGDLFDSHLIKIAWLTFYIIMNIAIIVMVIFRKRSYYYKKLSKNYREQFDAEFEYFLEYKKQNKDMAHFRHDWNNHMAVMKKMFDENNYEEAQKYFSQLPGVKDKVSRKVLSGNEAMDMVVGLKVPVMEEYDISFDMKGSYHELSLLSTVDICTIFFNLFDNAIEAASKCENERYIHIKSNKTAGAFVVVMENSMTGQLQSNGRFFKSTKSEEGVHGLGLQNVYESLNRYDATMEIDVMPDKFRTVICIPTEQK